MSNPFKRLFAAPEVQRSPAVGSPEEALSEVLRVCGQYSFDLDNETSLQVLKTLSALSDYVSSGVSDPVLQGLGASKDGSRDWSSILGLFRSHRIKEHHHVTQSVTELRQLLWNFVQILGSNFFSDRVQEKAISAQMQRLHTAIRENQMDKIKLEAGEILRLLDSAHRDKQKQQKWQLTQIGSRLKTLRAELEATRKELSLDGLTQLYNRAALDQHLEKLVHLNRLSGKPSTLLMIDIDFFKKINDTFGHPGGDAVLQGLARELVRSFPRKTDFVARFGGEEFSVLLEDDSAKTAMELAERLVGKARKWEFPFGSEVLRVTLSVGVAELRDGETIAAWLARADAALYAAKKNGRDQVAASLESESSKS